MKHIWAVLGASLLLLSSPGLLAAQDTAPVRVEGRVVWRAGQTAVIAPDGSPSVNVDLSRVPQDQYGSLKEGDVDGMLIISPKLLTTFPALILRLSLQHQIPLAYHRKALVCPDAGWC